MVWGEYERSVQLTMPADAQATSVARQPTYPRYARSRCGSPALAYAKLTREMARFWITKTIPNPVRVLVVRPCCQRCWDRGGKVSGHGPSGPTHECFCGFNEALRSACSGAVCDMRCHLPPRSTCDSGDSFESDMDMTLPLEGYSMHSSQGMRL